MEKLFWKLQFARCLKRHLKVPMKIGLERAEADLNLINYDLSECPKYRASIDVMIGGALIIDSADL